MNRDKVMPIYSEKDKTVNLGYFTNELFWNLLLRDQLDKAHQLKSAQTTERYIVNS
ncbi:MAG: hypothetical protein WBB29_22555 [Geitlerinemataceae cyanobacterium]